MSCVQDGLGRHCVFLLLCVKYFLRLHKLANTYLYSFHIFLYFALYFLNSNLIKIHKPSVEWHDI